MTQRRKRVKRRTNSDLKFYFFTLYYLHINVSLIHNSLLEYEFELCTEIVYMINNIISSQNISLNFAEFDGKVSIENPGPGCGIWPGLGSRQNPKSRH